MIEIQILLCYAFQGLIDMFAIKIVLTPKYSACITYIVYMSVTVLCGASNFIIFPHLGVKTMFAAAVCFGSFCFLFKDSLIKKIIVYFAFIAISMGFEFAAATIMNSFFGGVPQVSLIDPQLLFAVYLSTIIRMAICAIVYLCSKKFKTDYGITTLPSLVTLIISQAFILFSCVLMFLSQDTIISMVTMALAILFSVASNYFIIEAVVDLKFKKAAKEQIKTDEILYQKRLEASKQVLQNERELSKIRHDISGHIYTMRMMAENSNSVELSNYITDLLVK